MSRRKSAKHPPRADGSASPHNRVINESIPRDVLDCIDDPARVTPMIAGASCIRGRRLTVRSAGEDIDVEAPAKLLNQVFDLCDGTRSMQDILGRIEGDAAREEFSEFMRFLLGEGALIDANLASAHAARYALQDSPFGVLADVATTGQVCRRFLWNEEGAPKALPEGTVAVRGAPLKEHFDERVSTYTFDDKPVRESALHQLLWSLAGIVSNRHPRINDVAPQRTIASAGGMHLLEVYVVLRRQVGRHVPGTYRVHYPDERALWLERLNDGDMQLPRAFAKPWELTFATGAIFLAGDPVVASLRYRSRSMQYLFMEAGAALHNGGLSAAALGVGYATIGGYYESVVGQLCGLDRQWVLGSAIFGARPTAEQLALVERAPDLGFAWVNGTSPQFDIGVHLARANIKVSGEERAFTWGRGADPWLAMRKAIGEAVEREGYREPRGIVEGRIADIEGAIDPREFVRYDESQYQQPDFPYRPFDPERSYPWATGTDMTSGAQVRVLAELVYSRSSLAERGHDTPRPYTQVTSSGCAAGVSFDDAAHRALLEVIEREAFMRHWLKQEPGVPLATDRLPRDLLARIAALEAAGCRVCLQRLPSDWAHVALVGVQHEERRFTTMSTAAGPHLLAALASALEEVAPRVYVWLNGHAVTAARPESVDSVEHHFDLYGSPRYFRRADRVLFPTGTAVESASRRKLPAQTAQQIADRLASCGLHPILADITPKLCHVDQGRTRLWAVKALVPGLLPMSFGYQREPLGMVSRIHPGSKFPHPFP
jgi:ribosomal protein S12 methylthiotransferase accessory factor